MGDLLPFSACMSAMPEDALFLYGRPLRPVEVHRVLLESQDALRVHLLEERDMHRAGYWFDRERRCWITHVRWLRLLRWAVGLNAFPHRP